MELNTRTQLALLTLLTNQKNREEYSEWVKSELDDLEISLRDSLENDETSVKDNGDVDESNCCDCDPDDCDCCDEMCEENVVRVTKTLLGNGISYECDGSPRVSVKVWVDDGCVMFSMYDVNSKRKKQELLIKGELNYVFKNSYGVMLFFIDGSDDECQVVSITNGSLEQFLDKNITKYNTKYKVVN